MSLSPDNPMYRDDFDHFKQQAVKAVEALPGTPAEIRDLFAFFGMQAHCGNPNKCAIAEHLTRQVPLPEGYQWSIDGADAEINYVGEYWADKATDNERTAFIFESPVFPLTETVREFIREFDKGNYPEISEESSLP